MKMIEFYSVNDLFYCMQNCPICYSDIPIPPVITLYIYLPVTKANIALVNMDGRCRFYKDDNEIPFVDYKGKTYSAKTIRCNCNKYYYITVFVLDVFQKKLDHIYLSSQMFMFDGSDSKNILMMCNFGHDYIEIREYSNSVFSDKNIEIPFFEKIVTEPNKIYNRVKKLTAFT